MEREEQIKEALKRIEELKKSIGYQEIEDYSINKGNANYFLSEVDSEGKFQPTKTQLKKYALKSEEKQGFIKPVELEKEKKLYKELESIIIDFLGDDYLQIVFFENNSRYRRDEDFDLFNLIFKKTFSSKKIGKIKIVKSEDCSKTIEVGDVKNTANNHISIGIDLIYKNNLYYEGYNLKNQNILFYGYNIEENPYLMKLLEINSPKKILNIIPLGNSNSFYDNVD